MDLYERGFIMKVLIVIDMQHDFINGSLGSTEATKIVPYVKNKIEEYREKNQIVVFTRDTHSEEYLSTQEGKKLPVVHCIEHSFGWQIHQELPVQDSIVFDKPTFGCVELASYMKEHHANDEFEFVGVCTDICVISNAMLLKAYLPDNKITIDAMGCAGVTVESHKNALEAMKMCHIQVVND